MCLMQVSIRITVQNVLAMTSVKQPLAFQAQIFSDPKSSFKWRTICLMPVSFHITFQNVLVATSIKQPTVSKCHFTLFLAWLLNTGLTVC